MKSIASLGVAALALGPSAAPTYAQDGSWVDRISLNGDVRLRYEAIDEEFEEERNRMRFRARFGLDAEVSDNVNVVLQFGTGGDNPTSTNQSFDDGFSAKDIGLRLAYVDWQVNDSLAINAGKMRNPLFRAGKAPLLWDGDMNPEGFAAKFSSGKLFATAAAFTVEERGSSDDSFLYAVQAGGKFALGDAGKLTAGVGYFAYTNTVGNEPFYNGSAKGNTVDLAGNHVFDYKVTEVFAQYDTSVGDWPLSVFGHFAQNSEVSSLDTATAVGVKLGSAKDNGDMEFGWTFQDLEADATIGTFTDSDFGGGGTDHDGHILKAKYAFTKQIALGGTLFVNKKDVAQGNGVDYNRVQIDMEFKFK